MVTLPYTLPLLHLWNRTLVQLYGPSGFARQAVELKLNLCRCDTEDFSEIQAKEVWTLETKMDDSTQQAWICQAEFDRVCKQMFQIDSTF